MKCIRAYNTPHHSHTVFSLLSPSGGLFFSGPFKGGGGVLIGEGGLI